MKRHPQTEARYIDLDRHSTVHQRRRGDAAFNRVKDAKEEHRMTLQLLLSRIHVFSSAVDLSGTEDHSLESYSRQDKRREEERKATTATTRTKKTRPASQHDLDTR